MADRGDTAGVFGAEGRRECQICLDLTHDGAMIKASVYPLQQEGTKTLRGYERYTVDWPGLESRCATLTETLNRLASQGHEQRESLAALRRIGGLLFDELLSPGIKERLLSLGATSLLLSIDDGLVQIPWELLYDGTSFLCLRYAVGRVVRTEQEVLVHSHRRLGRPLQTLLLADALGNLASAYQEGRALRDALAENPDVILASLKATAIPMRYVLERFRDYDIVHFAGHAIYRQDDPGRSGWLLADGVFSPTHIRKLAGGSRPLPSLVFSNACQSGQTAAWRASDHVQQDIFGLANAFLLAGVRHYVGTFFDIGDQPSATLATAFYDHLLAGAPVGEALRAARQACVDAYGLEHPIWASYMLYGDPAVIYRSEPALAPAAAVTSDASVTELARARVQLDARLAAHSEMLCIMFADLVGSTAYFEEHGDIAGRAWVQRFRDRVAARVKQGGGRTIKGVGDGMLATFPRTDDALDVARRLLKEADRSITDVSQRTELRVALHWGPVVVEDDDVMGDAVNVVFRLVGHTNPGEALVSREAATSLVMPIPELQPAGVRSLKGREEPVHIYRLQVSSGVVAGRREPVATRSAIAATSPDLAPGVSVRNRVLIVVSAIALGVLFLVVGLQRGILPSHGPKTITTAGSNAGPMGQALSSAIAGVRDRLVREGIDRERTGDLDGAAAAYRQGLDVDPGDPYLQAFVEHLDQRMAATEQRDEQQSTDALIARISEWKRGQSADGGATVDTWTSRPLTLAFLGFTETGESGQRAGTAEYLALLFQDRFAGAPRVDVVERELLDALLRELNLSTTELVDQSGSLPIGRLLAARVLAAGRLVHLPDGLRVMVRLFDAETGLLLAVKSRDVGPRDDQPAAVAALVDELHEALLRHYPLRARLREITEDGLVIDAGYRAGMRAGQRLAAVVAELDASHVVLDTAHPHVVREVREGESLLDASGLSAPLSVGARLQVIEEDAP